MLEDEIVARRGYWRRQRQREEGLTTQESKLVNQLLLDIENVDVQKVKQTNSEQVALNFYCDHCQRILLAG